MITSKTTSIFVVEDQPIVKIGIMFMLQDIENVAVVGEASDGTEALSKILELRPDVTLMDIGIPGLDGIATTRQIKQSWPESKILILTSDDTDTAVFASLAAGADGYCLKTTSAAQLALAINVVRSGVVWLDAGIAQRVLRATFDSEARRTPEAPPPKEKFALSPREREVLELLVEGLSNQEMADRLRVGTETIKTHMRRLMEKLVVADRTQAAVKAIRQGIV